MSDVPIPAGAVGRPGMVAMLRRLGEGAAGRLIVIRAPAGYLSTMVGSPKPVFSWLARLLGQSVHIKGKQARDIYVPDQCLVPVGSMSDGDLADLIRDQGQSDLGRAIGELRQIIGATSMSIDEFTQFVDRASHHIGIERALEVVSTAQVLREIGFVPDRAGSETLIWAGVHAGTELRFHAGPDPLMGWTLVATGHTRETAIWDERRLPHEAPRGLIVEQVLTMWKNAFRDAPVPDALQIGEVHRVHRNFLREVNPALPTVHPDPVAFRAIRKWLVGADDSRSRWIEDRWVRISHEGAMLRIELDGLPFGCPASGLWVEDREVRLEDFAAIPSEVLRRRGVVLTQEADHILVNDWKLPSRVADV